MADFSDRPAPMQAVSAPRADVIDVPAHWLHDDELLGFECANPALQIERWGQESASGKTGYSA